jgi:RimJ/RimL family protein N-acetyltransferase
LVLAQNTITVLGMLRFLLCRLIGTYAIEPSIVVRRYAAIEWMLAVVHTDAGLAPEVWGLGLPHAALDALYQSIVASPFVLLVSFASLR